MNPTRFLDLVEDNLVEVTSKLDRLSLLALSLASTELYKRFAPKDLFGSRLLAACVISNSFERFEWALNELGVPFCLPSLSATITESTSPQIKNFLTDFLSSNQKRKVYLNALEFTPLDLDFVKGQCSHEGNLESTLKMLDEAYVKNGLGSIELFLRGAVRSNNVSLFKRLKEIRVSSFCLWELIEQSIGEYFVGASSYDHVELSLFFFEEYAKQREANRAISISYFSMAILYRVPMDSPNILSYLLESYEPHEEALQDYEQYLVDSVTARTAITLSRLLRPPSRLAFARSIFTDSFYEMLAMECLRWPDFGTLKALWEVAKDVVRRTVRTKFSDALEEMQMESMGEILPEYLKLVSEIVEEPIEWVIDKFNPPTSLRATLSEQLGPRTLAYVIPLGFQFDPACILKLNNFRRSLTIIIDVLTTLRQVGVLDDAALDLFTKNLNSRSTFGDYIFHNIFLSNRWRFEELVALFGDELKYSLGDTFLTSSFQALVEQVWDMDKNDNLLVNLSYVALANRIKRLMIVFGLELNPRVISTIKAIESPWKRDLLLKTLSS